MKLNFFKTIYYFIREVIEILISIITIFIPYLNFNQNFQVLIVPGILSGPVFYLKLKKELNKYGYISKIVWFPVYYFSISKKVKYLEKIFQKVDKKIIVIAHDYSGLLFSSVPDEIRLKIDILMTLGTPFGSSYLLNFISILGYQMDIMSRKFPKANYLFYEKFLPVSTIAEFLFFPKNSFEFGWNKDLIFDIPGSFNLVRRKENLETIVQIINQNFIKNTNYENEIVLKKLQDKEEKIITKKNTRSKK